jgi:hypothetical protein
MGCESGNGFDGAQLTRRGSRSPILVAEKVSAGKTGKGTTLVVRKNRKECGGFSR